MLINRIYIFVTQNAHKTKVYSVTWKRDCWAHTYAAEISMAVISLNTCMADELATFPSVRPRPHRRLLSFTVLIHEGEARESVVRGCPRTLNSMFEALVPEIDIETGCSFPRGWRHAVQY